jgi:hypothetical protein
MPSTHGGARAGSGRKPTRERFASQVAKVEKQIADKLPDLVTVLIGAAADGDAKAAQYLIDRILGKPIAVQEVSGPDGGPIPVQAYVAKELDRLYPDRSDLPAILTATTTEP